MGFTKGTSRVPTGIGSLVVTLISNADGSKSANYNLKVLDQDGQRIPYSGDTGDLVPYLTQEQITALISFMDGLRAQAIAQIINGS
jgi:hypothetical protein